MSTILGTNIAAAVVPFDSADAYPTHDARYGRGGWRSAASTAERNAIPYDRRAVGMVVQVGGTSYRLLDAGAPGEDLTDDDWRDLQQERIDAEAILQARPYAVLRDVLSFDYAEGSRVQTDQQGRVIGISPEGAIAALGEAVADLTAELGFRPIIVLREVLSLDHPEGVTVRTDGEGRVLGVGPEGAIAALESEVGDLAEQVAEFESTQARLGADAVPLALGQVNPFDVWQLPGDLISFLGYDTATPFRTRRFTFLSSVPTCAMEETRGPVYVELDDGQSLKCAGGTNDQPDGRKLRGSPAPAPHLGVMFNIGVMATIGNEDLDPDSVTHLVPAVETFDDKGTPGDEDDDLGGQTGIPSRARMFNWLCDHHGKPRRSVLLACHAQGGRPLTSLWRGTKSWNNGLILMRKAKQILPAWGRPAVLRDKFFNQGQAPETLDIDGNPYVVPVAEMADDWAAKFVRMMDEYEADAADPLAGFGEGFDPAQHLWWLTQTSAPPIGNTTPRALGQLRLAETDPRVRIVGPYYQWTTIDEVHLDGWLGQYDLASEMEAVAQFTERALGLRWTGFRPVDGSTLTVEDNVITLPFYKIRGAGPVVETTKIPPQPNHGIWGSEADLGSGVAITGASFTDIDDETTRLVVTLNMAPTAAEPKISAGLSGPGSHALGIPYARVRTNFMIPGHYQSLELPGADLDYWMCVWEKGTTL